MISDFHFPPDLMNLLIDTVPRLNKSKKDLLLFFKNVGLSDIYLKKYDDLLNHNNTQFNKFNVTREVLEYLNKDTDGLLGIRRNLLQKVVSFDSFEMCWENDRLKAKANVAEIAKIVNLKDSVTKLEAYAEKERQLKVSIQEEKLKKIQMKRVEYESIKKSLNNLFTITNPQQRGKLLENVLNDLFKLYGIGIKDAFTIYDDDSGKNYEQIDGAIEINNHLTLIEMKWENSEIGADKIARFISRLFLRAKVDGIIISYSSFTETGTKTANEALSKIVVSLIDLKNIIDILYQDKDLKAYFETVIRNTKLYKKSYMQIEIDKLPNIDFSKL